MGSLIDQTVSSYRYTDFISKLRARHFIYLCMVGLIALYSFVITAAAVFIGLMASLVSTLRRLVTVGEEADLAHAYRAEAVNGCPHISACPIGKRPDVTETYMHAITHTCEVTEARLKEAEHELAATKERLRLAEQYLSTVFHSSPLLISLSTAEDVCFVDVNDSFVRRLGYSREELIGRAWQGSGLWSNDEERERIKDRIANQRCVRDEEISWRSKNGEDFPVLFSAEVIEIGGVPHIMAFALDITDRTVAQQEKNHLENQLLQAQKMESVGRLAGALAHDFNNLLSIMLGYAEIGLEDPSIQALPIRNTLEQILKAGERVHNLTRQLLAFGRRQVLKHEEINLNHIILDFQPMLARLMGEDIEISTHLTEDPWRVLMDITQAEQILLNVAANARDAMPGGGHLLIKTANVGITEQTSRLEALPPGDYVELTISDTGCGIEHSVIRDIFEPFFTTKESGNGTGLGLSTVHGIVKQQGGEILVESQPGMGATFKIFLPRHRGTGEAMAIRNMDGFPKTLRHEAALVLEEEPAL